MPDAAMSTSHAAPSTRVLPQLCRRIPSSAPGRLWAMGAWMTSWCIAGGAFGARLFLRAEHRVFGGSGRRREELLHPLRHIRDLRRLGCRDRARLDARGRIAGVVLDRRRRARRDLVDHVAERVPGVAFEEVEDAAREV